jgi:signal transduction histidine kinase
MIISRHLSSRVFLVCILEVWLILAGLHLMTAPAETMAPFIWINPGLVVQCTWIALIGFVIHYLVHNIEARDQTIATLGQIIALADRRQPGSELESRWMAVLGAYLRNVGGRRGSVWLYSQPTGEINLLTHLSYSLGETCLEVNQTEDPTIIPVDQDHPVAEVVRTGQPLYCRAQTTLGDYLSRTRASVRVCSLPADIHARILVPLGEQSDDGHQVLGVLAIDFDRANPPREQLLTHYFEFLNNTAGRVVPILKFIQQMEELQTLRRIGVQVSSSLRLKDVLDDALDALNGPLGFELATISLVDEEAQLIRCMAGRNVPQAWIDMACHPLTSADIQADVVRTGKTEVIRGWDERYDRRIYKQFHHDQLVRAFVPIRRPQGEDDTSSPVQGVVEVGYRLRTQESIAPEQLATLEIFLDQVAVAIEKAHLFESTLQHRKLLAELHHVSLDLASMRQPDHVLGSLGEALQRVLNADIAMIYRFDRATRTIEPPRVFGEVWGRRPLRTAPLEGGIIAEILREGLPRYVPDVAREPLLSEPYPPLTAEENTGPRRTFTMRQNIKSFAGVPMLVNQEAVGVLCVNYRRRHAFGENERCALGLAAQLAAVALRNAEHNALAAELAVKEERDRLAEQLHDSVSQFVLAIPLMADTARKRLRTQPDQTAFWLKRIEEVSRKTMIEVRANLFEMEVATTLSRNLRQALMESSELAHEYFNLTVDIKPDAIPERLRIPIEAELLLFCREAIVNAARHANAELVTVSLSESNGRVCMQVQDDGQGFDLSTLSSQGMRGLKLMQQRIERMGGEITINTHLGAGTTIQATVPV